MDTKKERFLLAKINVLEHVNAKMLVIVFGLLKMHAPSIRQDFQSALRKSCQTRLAVREGTGEGAFEVQTEMLKQFDYFFSLIDHYEGS